MATEEKTAEAEQTGGAVHGGLLAARALTSRGVKKLFTLSGTDGLRSHVPDFGTHTPREITNFEDNFRATVHDWLISADLNPIPVEGTTWVPDFKLSHTPTGKEVFVEVLCFWRKVGVIEHYKRLKRALPGQFVLVVSEKYRSDEDAASCALSRDQVVIGEALARPNLDRLLAGCGKTPKTEATFRAHSANTRLDCRDCGIGTALEQGFGRVLGIGAQYGHGYAAAPSSLGRRTRL